MMRNVRVILCTYGFWRLKTLGGVGWRVLGGAVRRRKNKRRHIRGYYALGLNPGGVSSVNQDQQDNHLMKKTGQFQAWRGSQSYKDPFSGGLGRILSSLALQLYTVYPYNSSVIIVRQLKNMAYLADT